MSTVETIRGHVELTELGPTLLHEHVFVLDPESWRIAATTRSRSSAALGSLQQDSSTKKYRFGSCVLDLGFSAINSMEPRGRGPHLCGS